MAKKIILIILLAVLVFSFFPNRARAALVPCGLHQDDPETPEYENCPCSFCHFFIMFDRIVGFIVWTIVPLIGWVMLIAAGIMFIVATGNPEMLARAKKFILATIAGLFIIYSAWIILNAVFTAIQVKEWTGVAEGGFTLTCHVPGDRNIINRVDPPPPKDTPAYGKWERKWKRICQDSDRNCICEDRERIVSKPTDCDNYFEDSEGEKHTGNEWCDGKPGHYEFCEDLTKYSFDCDDNGNCTNFSSKNCPGGCTKVDCTQGQGCPDVTCREIACNYVEPAGPWAGHPKLKELWNCIKDESLVKAEQLQEYVDSNIGQTINGITITGAKCTSMCGETYLGMCDSTKCPSYQPNNPNCLCCHHSAQSDHYGAKCKFDGIHYGKYSYAMDISTRAYSANDEANANYQCEIAKIVRNVCAGRVKTGIKEIIGAPETKDLCPFLINKRDESHRSHLHIAIPCQPPE